MFLILSLKGGCLTRRPKKSIPSLLNSYSVTICLLFTMYLFFLLFVVFIFHFLYWVKLFDGENKFID